MKVNKTALEAFRVGDHITDNELHELLKFHENLEESLRCLGERFHLAWIPILNDMLRLQDYTKARKEKS